MELLTVVYEPVSGDVVPDAMINTYVENMITHRGVYTVGSSIIVDAVRRAIALDKIDHRDVAFSFEGRLLSVNAFGRIPEWPVGFADIRDGITSDILKAGIAKSKRN